MLQAANYYKLKGLERSVKKSQGPSKLLRSDLINIIKMIIYSLLVPILPLLISLRQLY